MGMDSRKKFGSAKNGTLNYGREAVGVQLIKNQKLTRSQPLDWYEFGLWASPMKASHYGHSN